MKKLCHVFLIRDSIKVEPNATRIYLLIYQSKEQSETKLFQNSNTFIANITFHNHQNNWNFNHYLW